VVFDAVAKSTFGACRRVENYHLPKTDAAREEWARVIAADGERFLAAVEAATDQPWLAQLPVVLTLRRVWVEQYTGDPGQWRWRAVKDMPSPAELISSPYDPEARHSTKRDVEWVGYKVHLTETCDEEMPHLIVNVETTPATTPDDNMIKEVHESLERRDLLPGEHLVDKGDTDAHVLVESRSAYGVTIVGPVAEDPSWQARAGEGFDKGSFVVDWDRQVVTCPAGKESISWLPNTYPQNGMVFEARFARKDCTPCPFRAQCTKAQKEPRIIGLQARAHHEALQSARRAQTTEEFRSRYAARAGIEGTHEQAIRRCGLRRCRYIGQAKAHQQHVLTAAAINIVRLSDWWAGRRWPGPVVPASPRCNPPREQGIEFATSVDVGFRPGRSSSANPVRACGPPCCRRSSTAGVCTSTPKGGSLSWRWKATSTRRS
jgi:transposase